MLSPHEFATLLLVKHSPDQLHMAQVQLETLRERQLVVLDELLSPGRRRWRLTEAGRSAVRIIRKHA